MGKQTQQQQQQHQLATPPGSTRIEAQLSDFLPELSLPPLEVSLDHTARTKRHAAVASRKRTLTHAAEEEASDVSSDAHREAQRDTATSRKRIAKPSRKTTHSQIEKRRREKINDTMARLKQLVPACHGDNAESLKKLDVLTETANYIDALHMQLRQYQAAAAAASVGEAEATEERNLHSRCSSLSATSSVLAFDAFTQPALSYSPVTREKTDSPISDLSLGSQTSASRAAAAVYLDERARTAAESLVQISESPMLGPVKRMSIAELMHL
jgi:hypothetical protein